MDIIILGVLMMRRITIYELRQFIEQNLSSISSSSTGSIQVGIKKLLQKEMISFDEQVENGVNKKVYYITELGKVHFEERVSTPMLYKEKNMELIKFFFMGFTDKQNQKESIDNYIKGLEKELSFLEQISDSLNPRYDFDKDYIEDLKGKGGASEFMTKENIKAIASFQYATLDFGIDKLKFEIAWFNGLKEKLEMEDI